jgi:hypothetical protein
MNRTKEIEEQTEKRTEKLIRLPDEVWEALTKDAARCRRSVTRQLEAILVAYYRLENVDLHNIPQPRETSGATAKPVDMFYPEPVPVPVIGNSPKHSSARVSEKTAAKRRR